MCNDMWSDPERENEFIPCGEFSDHMFVIEHLTFEMSFVSYANSYQHTNSLQFWLDWTRSMLCFVNTFLFQYHCLYENKADGYERWLNLMLQFFSQRLMMNFWMETIIIQSEHSFSLLNISIERNDFFHHDSFVMRLSFEDTCRLRRIIRYPLSKIGLNQNEIASLSNWTNWEFNLDLSFQNSSFIWNIIDLISIISYEFMGRWWKFHLGKCVNESFPSGIKWDKEQNNRTFYYCFNVQNVITYSNVFLHAAPPKAVCQLKKDNIVYATHDSFLLRQSIDWSSLCCWEVQLFFVFFTLGKSMWKAKCDF